MSHNAEPNIFTARYFISVTVTYKQHNLRHWSQENS